MENGDNFEIALQSKEGGRMLSETRLRQLLLVRIFRKRTQYGYCGTQSAALLMSARHFGELYKDTEKHSNCDVSDVPYLDTNLFSYEQTKTVVQHDELLKIGLTLDKMQSLLAAFGIPSRRFHADRSSVDEFRAQAMAALSHQDSSLAVLVNFEMTTMLDGKMKTCGHHSLLGAYHPNTDRFLLLDTSTFYSDRWLKPEEIFLMMDTMDTESGIKRGFLIVGSL
ncbi:uncharacterized protein [Diadema setosum]|uniref:uncharacterized protein n=1 Tax=Diadema setosum TaxID=31175 RepID=UPI003B3A6D24